MSIDTNFIDSFKEFKWKVGEEVILYTDIMNGEGLLGKGIIKEYVDDPEAEQTFIRKEMPSDKQEVWAPRECLIHITGLTDKGLSHNLKVGEKVKRKIAHPYRVGITSSKFKMNKAIPKYPSIRLDNFEIIPGWGQCF